MESVGRYQLVGELGRGGFGVVFEGRDPVSGAAVAVKVLEGLGAGSVGRAQLLGEAAALESVDSPFTLRVLDVVDSGAVLALVTDLVPGVPLRGVLDAHGQLSGRDALTVLHGAASGLVAVHAAGLVHGDVKPANILVGVDGGSKLIDFGLAALPGWISEDSASPWGSPAYASPEQVEHNFRDVRSDVYSLTVTLYEVLCGRRPFVGETAEVVRAQHVHEPLPDPRYFTPDLGDGLTQLLMWGLAKDPAARPADVGTWLAYLEAAAVQRYGAEWASAGSVAAVAGGVAGGGLLASGAAAGSGAAGVVVAGGAAGSGVAGAGAAGSAAASGGASAGSSGVMSGFLATATGKGVAAAVAVTAVATTGVGATYVARHVGGHDQTLTTAPVHYVDKIAYASCNDRGTRCGLHLMNPDGTGKTTLLTAPGWIEGIAISPSGTKIAYESRKQVANEYGDIQNSDIRVVNVDGTGDHRVARGLYQVWSPDSRKLTYTRWSPQKRQASLQVVGVGGSGETPVTVDARGGGTAAWSPDGTQVAYVDDSTLYMADAGGYRSPRPAYDCGGFVSAPAHVVNADGTGRRRSMGMLGVNSAPQWLPGGHGLVVTTKSREHVMQACSRPEAAVGVVSETGRERSELAGRGSSVGISPDRKLVAYWRREGVGTSLFVRPVGGGHETRVGTGLGEPAQMSWSPDSSSITYIANSRSHEYEDSIHVVDADGTHNRVVAHGSSPSWGSVPDSALASFTGNEAAPAPVTRATLASAQVPADCHLPAQPLVNGKTTRGRPGGGSIVSTAGTRAFGDLAGLGYRQALATYSCTAGGVEWPEVVLLVGSGGKLLGWTDLSGVVDTEHSTVTGIQISGKKATLTWDSYNGASADLVHYRGTLRYDGSRLRLSNVRSL